MASSSALPAASQAAPIPPKGHTAAKPTALVPFVPAAALPRPTDSYVGPYPSPQPAAARTQLARRINRLGPELRQQVQQGLQARCGWTPALEGVPIALVDRAGLRAALQHLPECNKIAAFLLSWTLPIVYSPELGRVLVVAPTARHYSDATLRFQLLRALTVGAIARERPDFFQHVALQLVANPRPRHNVVTCRGWALALGQAVASAFAPKGRKGPVWQRAALFLLRPLARLVLAPYHLARRFVPVLEHCAQVGPEGLVDRTFQFPALCQVLTRGPGRHPLVVQHTPAYKREDLARDVAFLRQYNAAADAAVFTAEL